MRKSKSFIIILFLISSCVHYRLDVRYENSLLYGCWKKLPSSKAIAENEGKIEILLFSHNIVGMYEEDSTEVLRATYHLKVDSQKQEKVIIAYSNDIWEGYYFNIKDDTLFLESEGFSTSSGVKVNKHKYTYIRHPSLFVN